jgi:hypothetical protein
LTAGIATTGYLAVLPRIQLARADEAKAARMLAHVDAQVTALREK